MPASLRHGQRGRIDAATMAYVGGEIDAYMRRPCHPAPAHGLTPLQAISAKDKALAMAEWAAMDNRGNLPDDWPERRAEIERQFELKGGRCG